MKILELVTKKFRPLGPFLYLKCRPVAQSTKIVSRHICQAKHLDILNDQCKPVTYFLSRSYCSHTSGNLQKISDMLDALNLEQIESKECRNIIFNLLEVCVNAEDRTFEGKDSFFVIYFIFHKRQSLNFLDFQKHQKHTLELTKFQKFLETLPDHLETMSVEDMVDIFGGLAMLGIPKTNFVITQLLLKILNPEVQLGLSEIAKLLLIFQDNFHFSHIIKFTFLYPTLKSCLTNLSSYDRDDLKYLSYLMEKSMIDTYPELLNIYMKIISEVFKDKQFKKDADCLSDALKACNNDVFSRVCEVAIPIFGNEISQDTMKRIEDIIFSKKGVKNAQRILRGSLYIPSGNNISLTIELNIKTAINEEIYSGSEIVDLISAGMEGKGLLKSKIQLTRFFARKLETLKGIEKSLLPVVTYNMDAILSEKMANRVLKYYVKHFNSLTLGQKPGSILLTLLRAFFTLSRLPEHTEELREISKHMLDTYLGNGLSASNSYQMLHYLCHFGIYFDEHLQEVFSSAWFDKLFDVISSMEHDNAQKSLFQCIALLNMNLVLLRPDLGIQWLPDDRFQHYIEKFPNVPNVDLPSYAKTSTFYFTLHHVLGGDEYFKTGVPIEYELLIDFEYFVDSNKMPVNYEEAKKMDLTKSDIKKCAVYCGRPRNRELMAKDKDAVSVDSAQKILHLRTLGYQVAFIHKPDWMSLITDSDRYIYMRSTLGISKPPDTTSDTKDLKDGGHHDTAQSPYLEVY